MQKINRAEIEKLLFNFQVVKTKVEQDKKELRVFTTLSNRDSFLVKYDLKTRRKSYFRNWV